MPQITLTISDDAAKRVKDAFDYMLDGEREATTGDVEDWLKRRLRHLVYDVETRKMRKQMTPQRLDM